MRNRWRDARPSSRPTRQKCGPTPASTLSMRISGTLVGRHFVCDRSWTRTPLHRHGRGRVARAAAASSESTGGATTFSLAVCLRVVTLCSQADAGAPRSDRVRSVAHRVPHAVGDEQESIRRVHAQRPSVVGVPMVTVRPGRLPCRTARNAPWQEKRRAAHCSLGPPPGQSPCGPGPLAKPVHEPLLASRAGSLVVRRDAVDVARREKRYVSMSVHAHTGSESESECGRGKSCATGAVNAVGGPAESGGPCRRASSYLLRCEAPR